MGFGILFCGYILRIINFVRPEYTIMIACAVMAVGLFKLSPQNNGFNLSFKICIAMTALGGLELLFAFLPDGISFVSFIAKYSLLKYLREILWLLFHATLTLGIRLTAKEVGTPKIERRARNIWIMCAAYYVFFAVNAAFNFFPTILELSMFAFMAAWQILCAILIFNCYMYICMPDDVDMDVKPSNFEFVNAYREQQQERERMKEQANKEKNDKK